MFAIVAWHSRRASRMPRRSPLTNVTPAPCIARRFPFPWLCRPAQRHAEMTSQAIPDHGWRAKNRCTVARAVERPNAVTAFQGDSRRRALFFGGRTGWQINRRSSGFLNECFHTVNLVGTKVVYDDDLTGFELRAEHMFRISQEDVSIRWRRRGLRRACFRIRSCR
jgi:hypothetical protein